MFAGCIEFGNTNYGQKLFKLASSVNGLADIPYDHSGKFQHGGLTLVEQSQNRHKHDKNYDGLTQHAESGIVLVGWLRIDNREDLSKTLKHYAEHPILCDHDLILAAYLKWGAKLCDYLIGDFSLVIHDPRVDSTLFLRDQMGARPLYYLHSDNLLIFATSIAVLTAVLPQHCLTLNQSWLASYLLNISHDWRETPYQNIVKVPPAHTLNFTQGKLEESCYFEFDPEPSLILLSDDEYVDAYREILDEAVRCRTISDYPIGSESSGGMDSSTVTVLASKHINKPKHNLHTFGFANYHLESECITAVSQSTQMNSTHLITQGTPLNNISTNTYKQFSSCVGTPCESFSPLSHTAILQLANKLRLRSMLSGFGGDEFVTTFGALARVELWENRHISDWLKLFHGNRLTSTMRAIRWLARYRRTNNCFETATNAIKQQKKRWQNRIINDEVSEKYSLKQRALKSASYDSGYTAINEFILNNRWSPNMTVRLENSCLYAAHFGIEYSFPLLDIRLINFFLSVPAQQKFGAGGIGRYLHRRAIRDIVPDIIVNKTKEMGAVKSPAPPPLFDASDFPDINSLSAPLAEIIDPQRYKKILDKVANEHYQSNQHRYLINFLTLNRWLNDTL